MSSNKFLDDFRLINNNKIYSGDSLIKELGIRG